MAKSIYRRKSARKSLAADKISARRAYRHAAKIAVAAGSDVNETPRYTERDVI